MGNMVTHILLFYSISFVLFDILPCASTIFSIFEQLVKNEQKNTAAKSIFITPPVPCSLTSQSQPTTPPPHLYHILTCLCSSFLLCVPCCYSFMSCYGGHTAARLPGNDEVNVTENESPSLIS